VIKLPKSAKITDISFEIDNNDVGDLNCLNEAIGLNPQRIEIDGQEYMLLSADFESQCERVGDGMSERSKIVRRVNLRVLACDSPRLL